MENKTYCVIMAGGKGTRFWPRSRKAKPKQFLDILGTGKTFIRSTYERFAHVVPKENFLVVTHQRYRDQVKKYLPELEDSQILCEPRSRNTAPCIAYAAYSLLKRDPEAKMIVTPADHFILQEVDFVEIIKECLGFIESENALMTLGIEPSRPDTGYGYIQRSSDALISRVKCFTEKPNLELAQAFVSCGEFLWNSGIFIWKVKDIVAAFERHLPEHHQLFESIIDDIGTEREKEALERVYSECKSISIDFGVMEKADNVYVRAGDFGWSDVGTWGSVYQLSQKDRYANAKPGGDCYSYDTRRCVISIPRDKIAVVSGLKDYIVVDTPDVLLICPRSEEQGIKKYIDDIRFEKGEQHT